MPPTLSLSSRFKAARQPLHAGKRVLTHKHVSRISAKVDDGSQLMIDELQSMRSQMAQLLDIIAMQQQQNMGIVNRIEELSKQVHANGGQLTIPSPSPSFITQSLVQIEVAQEVAAPVEQQKLEVEEPDDDVKDIKRRSEALAKLLQAKGITPPASLLSTPTPPFMPSTAAIPSPEDEKKAEILRPVRSGPGPSESSEPPHTHNPNTKPKADAPGKWRSLPKTTVSAPQSKDAVVSQRNDIKPSSNPVLRKIATARRWQDLQSMVDRQPQGLDAVAVASAFSRLPSLLKSHEVDQEANEFATQLLQLLQLQLQSLPSSSLANLLGACSCIPGISATQRTSWVTGALRAVGNKINKMTLSEIANSLLGLNSLGAEPDEEWTTHLFQEVQSRFKGAAPLSLDELGLVLRAISNLNSEIKPDAAWMRQFEATCMSLSSLQPSPSSLKGIVGLVTSSRMLKSALDPALPLSAMKTALGLDDSSTLNQAIQLLQLSLTAQELVDLAASIPDEPLLLSAIAEATWPKLSQLPAASSLTLFNALVAGKYEFPSAMITSFTGQLASTESLDGMSSREIVTLLSTLSSISSSALSPSSLENVQEALMDKGLGLAKSTSRLDPETLTSLLSSLASLEAALKPSLLPAIIRDVRPQLKSLDPATFSLMASSLGRLTVTIDMDFVEAVVEDLMERSGHSTCVVLVNALALMNVKPRASLMGPLLASVMELAPSLPNADLIALLSSMATLKLKREETQGILKATTPGGSPSPQDVVTCLLLALKLNNFDLLSMKDVSSVASHLKALCDPSLSTFARHPPPPSQWTVEFLSSFSRKLMDASTGSIVLVLSCLPSLSRGLDDSPCIPQGFIRSCLGRIEATMDEMGLEELSEVVEAATFSSSGDVEFLDATFTAALAHASQSLLGSQVHNVSSLARFTCALARAGIAPSPLLLDLIVQSSSAHVKATKDGVSSASGSHRSIALLLWGVSQLAKNTSQAVPSGPSAASLIVKEWVQDIVVSINRVITSSRSPFTLDDLARVIWAFAMLDVQPKRDTINSFIGKSIDRLSMLESDSCLNVIWALSSLGCPMQEKWLNQWAIRAMPALGGLETQPQTLAKVIAALHFHHQASSSLPSPYLMRALITLLSNNLRHKRTDLTSSALMPSAGEPHLSSPQLVLIMTHLSSLGVSSVMQEAEESRGLCSLLFSAIVIDSIDSSLILDALAAVSLMLAAKERSKEKDADLSAWTLKAAKALSQTNHKLKGADAARLVSALALLSVFVERESIAQVSELIEASSAVLLSENGTSALADGLSLPNAVEALWGLAWLSTMELSQPPSALFVSTLIAGVEGKIGTLNASQLMRLMSGLSIINYQPSGGLALELSRAAVSRFSSSSVAPSELADVVFSFAQLGCSLPPSFASSAQRRLQASMVDLKAPALAKMMWSLARSGYLPSEPQMRAYASRVTSALDGMNLEDLSLSLEAFALFKHRLDSKAVERVVKLSLPLLSESNDGKRASTLVTFTQNLLWHANGSSVLTDTTSHQWIKAFISAMDSQALLMLTPNEACLLISSLSQLGSIDQGGFDLLGLLSQLPPISDLDATSCQDLLTVILIWKEALVPNDPRTGHVLKEIPVRIVDKLAAYTATDSAALLTCLASLASSAQLLPLFERKTLSSLMSDLAANASSAVPSLSARDVARLVSSMSGSRAAALSLSSDLTADVADERVNLLTRACVRIKDGCTKLKDKDLVLLIEALSRESEESAGLRSRMSRNGIKPPDVPEAIKKKDQELRALMRQICVAIGETMASESRLLVMEPELFARFLDSYCKHLKFGSYSLLLTKEQEEEERRRDKGEVASAQKGWQGPSEPRAVLEMSLSVTRARMEGGSLAGWEPVSVITRAIASSGAVPTSAWIAAMKQACAARDPAPDAGSATRLLYSFVCWQVDPSKDFASLLLEGALQDSSSDPPDLSVVLLGYSHCSTYGYQLENEETLTRFVSHQLIPSLSSMSAEQLATVATSLSSFKGRRGMRDELAAALYSTLESVNWDGFSSHLIAQLALNLIAVRSKQSGAKWITAAFVTVRGRKDGAIAVKHLQDLQTLNDTR